jgi:hypothetical protein
VIIWSKAPIITRKERCPAPLQPLYNPAFTERSILKYSLGAEDGEIQGGLQAKNELTDVTPHSRTLL